MNLKSTWPALALIVGLVIGSAYAVMATGDAASGVCTDADPDEAGHQDFDDGSEAEESEADDGADEGPDADPNEPGHQDADDGDDDESQCGSDDGDDDLEDEEVGTEVE